MTESGMLARVIFDEAHSEAWTTVPSSRARCSPPTPATSPTLLPPSTLAERDFVVESHAEGPLTEEALAGAGVLVIAHPSDPAWERTTGIGSPRLSEDELDAVEAFVERGGGLIVLGETEQDKYGNNLNELLARFGLHLDNDTVQDYEHHRMAPSWVLADLQQGARGRAGDVLARVGEACLYRATTISSRTAPVVLARAHRTASTPGAPLIVAPPRRRPGGRARRLGSVRRRLPWRARSPRAVVNLCYWTAQAEGGVWPVRIRARRARPRARLRRGSRLRDETNALALLQAPDGALLADADPEAARGHVEVMGDAIQELAPRFPQRRGVSERPRSRACGRGTSASQTSRARSRSSVPS